MMPPRRWTYRSVMLLVSLTSLNVTTHRVSPHYLGGVFAGFQTGALVFIIWRLGFSRSIFSGRLTTALPASKAASIVVRVGAAPAVGWIVIPVPDMEGRDRDLTIFVSPEGPVSELPAISDDPSPAERQWN